MLHITGRPVIKRRCTPDVFKLFADPAGVFISILPIDKTTVTLHGFICPDSQQTDCLFVSVGKAVPPSELFCQIFLMHFVVISCHRVIFQIDDIRMIRHRTYPYIFFHIVPGIPVHLITAHSRAGRHGQTDPVWFHILFNVSFVNLLAYRFQQQTGYFFLFYYNKIPGRPPDAACRAS